MEDDESVGGPGAIAAFRASAFRRKRLDVWALLDAALPSRGVGMAAAGADDRSGPPVLRLLPVSEWGERLDGMVIVQAIRGDLYVRTQTRQIPDRLAIEVTSDDGRSAEVEGRRLPEGTGVFALPLLNGGGDAGVLWWFEEVEPSFVLGPARALTLRINVGGEASSVGPIRRPISDWPDRAAPRYLADLIRAYTAANAETFASSLARVCREQTGSGERARPGNDWWRRLTRWEALWVRAMLAEIERVREVARYGCRDAWAHPQLGVDRL